MAQRMLEVTGGVIGISGDRVDRGAEGNLNLRPWEWHAPSPSSRPDIVATEEDDDFEDDEDVFGDDDEFEDDEDFEEDDEDFLDDDEEGDAEDGEGGDDESEEDDDDDF